MPPVGALIFLAVTLLVAIAAFSSIQRIALAALASLLLAGPAFALICVLFNAIHRMPTFDEYLLAMLGAVPATVLAAISKLFVRWVRSRGRDGRAA